MIDLDRENILKYDIEQLWNACQLLEEDPETLPEHKQNIQKAKNGIKIKVPIYHFIQEWFEIYPNTRKAKIIGYGKYELNDFMEEIETRNKIMRQILNENITDNTSTEPR